MYRYESLDSERYLYESIKMEDELIIRNRNRKAESDFKGFLIAVAFVLVGIVLAKSFPLWLPAVRQFALSWL